MEKSYEAPELELIGAVDEVVLGSALSGLDAPGVARSSGRTRQPANGLALRPRFCGALPPIRDVRRCDARTRQSISHNSFSITASQKAFVRF